MEATSSQPTPQGPQPEGAQPEGTQPEGTQPEGEAPPSEAPPPEPLRYERRAPRILLALLLLQVGLVVALGASIGSLDEALGKALEPLGARLSAAALQRVVAGTMVSLCVLVPLSIGFTICALLRRYGWAELHSDHVRLGYPFVPARVLTSKLPLAAISERRVTRSGLQLRAPRVVLLRNSLYPLALPLVPLEGEAELAAVLAHLDAQERGEQLEPFRFGRAGRKDGLLLALSVTAVVLVVVAALVPAPLYWRLGSGSPTAVAFLLATIACFVSAVLLLRAFGWWVIRGIVLGDCLYLGQKAFLLRELSGAAMGEQVLAVWSDTERALALFKPEQESELREALARSELAPQDELPAWALRRRRVRDGSLAVAAFLALTVGFIALVELTPSAVFSRWEDPYGQRLALAFARDGRPLVLVLHGGLLEPALAAPGGLGLAERDEDWPKASDQVDAAARVWRSDLGGGALPEGVAFLWSGTPGPRALAQALPRIPDPFRLAREVELQDNLQSILVVLQTISARQGKAGPLPRFELPGSASSTPARVAHFFPELPPGPLRDYVEGRTSTRCFHAQDEQGARLIAGVSHGRVEFFVLAAAGQDVQIYLGGIGFQTSGSLTSPARLTLPSQRCVRVLSDGSLRSGASVPTLDEVLTAVRKAEAGESVEDAAGALVPPG